MTVCEIENVGDMELLFQEEKGEPSSNITDFDVSQCKVRKIQPHHLTLIHTEALFSFCTRFHITDDCKEKDQNAAKFLEKHKISKSYSVCQQTF